MSSERFTKENLDDYLRELGKEFRRLNGTKIPAEIVLVGGAAILANYGFRDNTTDIDAIMNASSAMKEAINRVGDRKGLPNGWLNADFMKTASFSQKLIEVSAYYKTFSNVLTVRTVSAEYLIAMKLRSNRGYKNDLSDIIGILLEHEERGIPITLDKVSAAVEKLYGGWANMPEGAESFISDAIEAGNYERRYELTRTKEKQAKSNLMEFEKQYPGELNESNVNEVAQNFNSGKKPSVRARLKELQQQRDAMKDTEQDFYRKSRDDFER